MFKRALLGCAALVTGGVLAAVTPATLASASDAQTIRLTVTGDGTHGSASRTHVHPGWLSVHVQDDTTAQQGVQLTVASLREDYTVGRMLKDIDAQIGPNSSPPAAAASTRDLNKIAIAYGGADTFKSSFTSDSVYLPRAGTYYAISTTGGRASVIATLKARGARAGDHPTPQATIHLGNAAGKDVITLSGDEDLPTNGVIRVANDGGGIHLMQMMKIHDGVTDGQVQAEFDAFLNGQTPTSDPAGLNGPPSVLVGADVLSTGHSSLLRYNVPAGTYLVLCFVADDMTGLPHAFMGMHLVVHVGE
jgi:hypothetical protein